MALEYLHATDDGWRLFKNAYGFIEGFKKYLSGLRPKKARKRH